MSPHNSTLAKSVAEKIIKVNDNSILVGTGSNLLGLLEIQLEGKKKLFTEDFLKGSPIDEKWIFGK